MTSAPIYFYNNRDVGDFVTLSSGAEANCREAACIYCQLHYELHVVHVAVSIISYKVGLYNLYTSIIGGVR